jgi:hypothetical protein
MHVKAVLPSVEAKQPLDELDGLTIWHEARLEEEDIENVPNMATADVVDLMLHTQIPAERLLDWVDQAILFKVLGPDKEKDLPTTRRGRLRIGGMRTATQLVHAYELGDKSKRDLLSKLLSEGRGLSPVPTRRARLRLTGNLYQRGETYAMEPECDSQR